MDKLYNRMGVVPRADLQEEITALDEDARKILRSKRVKLGPILVFLPELNKPKGVRLRGLLWSLWNGKDLPAPLPADGAVSVKIDTETVNRDMHLAVGYPIYGNRAIRIDMLDRVINAIYDSAENGKFKAQHSMAEWLGCSIEDLYGVLSSMGHNRIIEDKKVDEASKSEDKKPEARQSEDEKSEDKKPEAKKADEEPVLDTFWLKKGQAHKTRVSRPSPKKKDFRKTDKSKKFSKKGSKKPYSNEPRVVSAKAEVKPEDNPFAILAQLKSK